MMAAPAMSGAPAAEEEGRREQGSVSTATPRPGRPLARSSGAHGGSSAQARGKHYSTLVLLLLLVLSTKQ